MIEIFLFVNPLGDDCYESGKTIISFANERKEKVNIRFIPYINFRIINNQLNHNLSRKKTLEIRNLLFNQSYDTSLAFHAASMQGKKKGNQFFLNLQQQLFDYNKELTNELIISTAYDLNLDMEMFLEDWDSDLAKQAFSKNQKLAHEMSITDTPTCVVNYEFNSEHAYRIESTIEKKILHKLCNTSNLDSNMDNNVFQIL